VTVIESLRKNVRFLLSGFASAVVVFGLMRWSNGEPLVQPQSDLGLVLGVILVAAFMVLNDLRASNGKKQS
jgi:hypothetical protein